MNTTPTFDAADALSRLDGDESLLVMLIGVFAQESKAYEQGLNDALAAGSWTQLRAAAHRVKGASGSVGLSALHSLALELERFCADGGADANPGLAVEKTHQLLEALHAGLTLAQQWASMRS